MIADDISVSAIIRRGIQRAGKATDGSSLPDFAGMTGGGETDGSDRPTTEWYENNYYRWTRTITYSGAAFTKSQFVRQSRISILFAGATQGAWWDIQDLGTLWANTARTVPAVVGGTVQGQTDKSGNGRHRSQSTVGSAPILRQRSDGPYYLDYTGGKTLAVSASTALFNYLHNGDGGSIAAMLEWPAGATASDYMRSSGSTASVGAWILKSASTEAISYTITRGVSGEGAALVSIPKAHLSSALRLVAVSYKNDAAANDAQARLDDGYRVEVGATAFAPSVANATSSLSIADSFSGHEYGCIVLARRITDSEHAAIYAAFRQIDYPTPARVDLTLILGGQSNMSGRGTTTTIEAEEKEVGVYSYTKNEEYRIATIPEHDIRNWVVETLPKDGINAANHGHALRAAKLVRASTGGNVLLVPCAVGSTSIAEWDVPADVGNREKLFGAMVYRYRKTLAKGGAPVFVWYGHEGSTGLPVPDYVTGGVGTTYQTAWASLVSNLRIHVADAPMIFCQLAADNDLSTSAGLAAAGEAQRQTELTVPDSFMVVTHDVERNASTDDIHVSRAGHDVVANRVALAIREHVYGQAVDGTGPRLVSAIRSGAVITLTLDREVGSSGGNYGDLFRVYDNNVEGTVSSAVRATNTSQITLTCSATLTGPVTLTYGYRAGPASAARTDFVKGTTADALPLPLFGPLLVAAA